MLATVSSHVGPYQLIEQIGIGGMAEVFKASQAGEEGFERMVAVKRILPNLSADPDFEKMFIDEAKIAVQLQHPNIAQIYDLGRDGESLFIAMEYVHGRDMSSIIERQNQKYGRTLPLSFVVQVTTKVCEALHHAHAARGAFGQPLNLIHRDITPQNILVSFEGAVKVVDFGLARAAGRLVTTQAGVVKGKLAYLSAEQARGEDIDHRSDIFSLGTCLYEWLTGQRLFLRRNDPETVVAVQQAQVPPLRAIRPELPQALDAIVRRALQPDPRNRYQVAGEMQEDLLAFAMEAGMPVRRRRLIEVVTDLFPEELPDERSAPRVTVPHGERVPRRETMPRPPSPPPPAPDESAPFLDLAPEPEDESTADGVPRDTVPAPPGSSAPGDVYEDATHVLLDADEAVMQVVAAPQVPREMADMVAQLEELDDGGDFEDEVSAVPIVDFDSSAEPRPQTPPGRTPLTAPDPEPLPGEDTGDFAFRAEAIAQSSAARRAPSFDEPTSSYSEADIARALADEARAAHPPMDDDFDEPTRAYSAELTDALLGRPAIAEKEPEGLVFSDETLDERPADALEELLEDLEPLEGEATRTDGKSDE